MRRAWTALMVLITMACGPFLVAGIDGSIGLSAPTPFYFANPGVPVVLRVANLGDTQAPGPIPVDVQLSSGLTIASVAPAAWSCTQIGPTAACQHVGDLPAGGVLPDLELEVAVGTPEEVKEEVRICGTLRIDNDVNPNNDTICQVFTATPPTAAYDLETVKTVHNAFDPTTHKVTYRVDVTNNGPDPMTDTMVLEDLALGDLMIQSLYSDAAVFSCQFIPGGGECTSNYLGVGQTAWATFTFEKTTDTIEPIENCATVSAPQDTNPSNDESCITFTPGQPDPFDLSVTAEIHEVPSDPFPGTYRWFITNNGPNPTLDPFHVFVDAPPSGTSLAYLAGVFNQTSSATNTADCIPVGNQIRCNVVQILQPGDTKILWMSFYAGEVLGAAHACLSVDPLGDTDPSNNEACLGVDVDPSPSGPYVMSLSLEPLGDWTPGAPAALRATVTNVGTGPAEAPIVLTTKLPRGVQFTGLGGRSGFTCQGGSRAPDGEVVTCFLEDEMVAEEMATLDLSVWVDEVSTDEICAGLAPGNEEGDEGRRCVSARPGR